MGSRRLPRAEALAAFATALTVFAAVACKGGGSTPEPSASAFAPTVAQPTPSAAATIPPPATATPDPLGAQPKTPEDALRVLAAYLPGKPACPPLIATRWGAACLSANLDGDGRPDTVYLIPLQAADGVAIGPKPAVVAVQRSSTGALAHFPAVGHADMGDLGKPLFVTGDRSGDGLDDISYLATECGAHTCTSRVEIQAWDGSAWRDLGPGDDGVPTLDRVALSGTGTDTTLTMHGGTIGSMGAGPTRPETAVYRWDGTRYRSANVTADPPQYLFHAILDADAKFAAGDYTGAAAAYAAALARSDLKDWQKEAGRGDGRARLEGYALFRIALATAAAGADPSPALDAAITKGPEQAFITAAEAFRKGYRERGGVAGGCLEATRYLTSPGVPEYLRSVFDYGYANPQKPAIEICPL